MSSKRSHDASNGKHGGKADKRLKVQSDTSKENTAQRTELNQRLLNLRQQIAEAKNDAQLLAAEPGIATAVSVLDSLLHRREDPSNLSQAHKKSRTTTSDLKGKGAAGLPSLPSISKDHLEKAVFTHPAQNKDPALNYDRLEILGDAYIELIATNLVWDTFPDLGSGRLSQIRELLVKNETLAAFADSYGFSRRAIVPSSYADQPKLWIKTRGDIFEAYVAAVILSDPEDGYKTAERWLNALWLPKLVDLGPQKTKSHSKKEELATMVKVKGVTLEYTEEKPPVLHKATGSQTFFIGVYLTGYGLQKKHLGSGQGSSKNAAGDEAAKTALANRSLMSQLSDLKKASLDNK